MTDVVVFNTILGRPFQIKSGMVDSAAENTVTISMLGLSFLVRSLAPTQEENPLTHVEGEKADCGKDLAKGSQVTHYQTNYGVAKGSLSLKGYDVYGGGDKPRTYRMVFPKRAGPSPCPVNVDHVS